MSQKQPETLKEWAEAYPCLALQPAVAILVGILSARDPLLERMAEALREAKVLLEKHTRFRSGEGKIQTIKPSHGPCCTCQDCGMDYDECCCEHNAIYDQVAIWDVVLAEYDSRKEATPCPK